MIVFLHTCWKLDTAQGIHVNLLFEVKAICTYFWMHLLFWTHKLNVVLVVLVLGLESI